MLLHYETETEAQAAAMQLRRFGRQARRLLGPCVEGQELMRQPVSNATQVLSDAGFIFVRDSGDIWTPEIPLKRSLRAKRLSKRWRRLKQDL